MLLSEGVQRNLFLSDILYPINFSHQAKAKPSALGSEAASKTLF